MPRPKSILWVDDEVESLTSHILFLEEHGFTVDKSPHGDDALVMLQRQPYGVVLLDEQMPGRRGLEIFQAIRAVDQSMPVVMVTKSEEQETLKDAIGWLATKPLRRAHVVTTDGTVLFFEPERCVR